MGADAAETSGLPAGLDDSWMATGELPCPQCGYNLSMRREPRCPECGLRFRWQALLQVRCPRCEKPLDDCDDDHCPRCRLELDWPLLLDRAARVPRKSFEYAHRPARVLGWVIFGVLRPRTFWQSLKLEYPPVNRRLWALMRVTWPLAITVLALVPLALDAVTAALLPGGGWMWWSFGSGWLSIGFACWLAAHSILPIATCALLPLFQETLGGYRIRGAHLLRIAAYGGVLFVWLALAKLLAYTGLRAADLWAGRLTLFWSATTPILLLDALLASAWAWFYYAALRWYLRLGRLDRWALLISTHVIGVLAVAVSWLSVVWF